MIYHTKYGVSFEFEQDGCAEPDVGIFSDSFSYTGEWEMEDYDEFVESAPDFDWDGKKESIPEIVESMVDTIEDGEFNETIKWYRTYDDPF